jgi:outer membrane protein OmpU
MKKVLLGTSAIALASAFASPAAAAEWDVRVGGYSNQAIGYGSSNFSHFSTIDGDYDGVDVLSNTEVFFLPTITLDNGVKFGMNIQLEGNTSGDQIDESYMHITGSFGTVDIGSENSAGYKMTYAAPSVAKVPVDSGSMSAWIPFNIGGDQLFRGTLGSAYLENDTNNDAQRITYYTPRVAGFQVGASYARDAKQDSSSATDVDTVVHDFFDVGANYVNSFGGVDIAISGRYGTASRSHGDDPEVWAVGGQLGYMGFKIGGLYGEQNDDGYSDGNVWTAGASYTTGPWAFSVEYIEGENVDNDVSVATNEFYCGTGHLCFDEQYKAWEVAANYTLAKGVTLFGFGAYVDFDEDFSNEQDVNGFVIGTGVGLSW